MKLSLYSILILVFSSLCCYGQNMQKGYSYLENGKYPEAVSFFKKVLKKHPDNKTAQLCYGRAVGLNGDATQAVAIFTELMEDYPSDFEIRLNYAEALLWNQQFEAAENYYKILSSEDASSFPALLGYANTLSNLKKYPEAQIYVNKALEVLPKNPNAMLSKKYIQLGYADQLTKQQKYDEAIAVLKNNLTLFENDQETLKNLVNTYVTAKEFGPAKKLYYEMATSKKDSIASLNGLSLIAHFENKNKAALKTSETAIQLMDTINDAKLLKQTASRYAQALVWNKKYREAERYINTLVEQYPNENWPLSLRATLSIYKGDFKNTIADYDKILENEVNSFDANLGKASALKAAGRYTEAYAAAEQALVYYENQKDVMQFLKTLNMAFTPYAESITSYSYDNGHNNAIQTQMNLVYPVSVKTKLKAYYSFRKATNDLSKNSANTNTFLAGASHQLQPNITCNAMLGFMTTNTETNDYKQFLADVSINAKLFKLHALDAGYRREMETFNADLLEQEIVKDNFYINYNIGTNFNLGWFNQYYYTAQSDGNERNLLFSSLYYNIYNRPFIKGGINFQAIAFKNQVPETYFSPAKFRAYELFVDFLKDENLTKNKGVFYHLNGALGYQIIENDPKQGTYRVQAKLGYRFNDRLIVNAFAIQSNIASATAAGFNYTEYGIRIKWYFSKRTVFTRN